MSSGKPGEPGNVNGAAASGTHGFQRGKSGNPGGRVAIAPILESFGKSPDDVRRMLFQKAIAIVEAGPKGANDPTWRYCHQWVGDRVGLKEALVIEIPNEPRAAIDWSKVPSDRRRRLAESMAELDMILASPEDTEH